MYCRGCGAFNDDNNYQCTQCGRVLHDPMYAPVRPSDDDLTQKLIPYRNGAALAAYYLGVFSLIPCLGMPLGIAAFFLGLSGLRFAREHPESHGTVHAWIGIILGGLCGFGQLLTIVLMIFMPALTR